MTIKEKGNDERERINVREKTRRGKETRGKGEGGRKK